MKAYRLEGRVVKHNERFSFRKELAAESEAEVTELLLSDIGSKHRAKRTQIHIESITELSSGDVTDPITAHRLTSA